MIFAVINLQFVMIDLQYAVISLQFAVIDLQNVGLLWNDLQPKYSSHHGTKYNESLKRIGFVLLPFYAHIFKKSFGASENRNRSCFSYEQLR